jgi:hypothetical protein
MSGDKEVINILSCNQSRMGYERISSLLFKNESSGLVWFKTGVWKLRGMRKGYDKGRCPCTEMKKVTDTHIGLLLKCSETRN